MAEAFYVRTGNPARSKVAAQTKYPLYRDDLRRDFLNACGYCGDDDERTDRIGFHIDHFAPKVRFPELELTYDNLVYACRFCNVSKSDHWIGDDSTVPNDGERGFVDPCSHDYEAHLERQPSGRIVGKTKLGEYIVRRLKLNLLRHELLWQARRARKLRNEVDSLIDELEAKGQENSPHYIALLTRFRSLTQSIEEYELRANN